MPFLILVRHGNTFEKDQTPTWVGARTDLPLTQDGEEQARKMAALTLDRYAPLEALIAGPLKRTQRMAALIGEATDAPALATDPRLTEIDYGLWENKSGDEIVAAYGAAQQEAWEKEGLWPEGMGWSPSLEVLQANIAGFLAEQHAALQSAGAQNRLAVTSNGILRFVYRTLTGQHPGKEAKVKTGAYCVLEPQGQSWTVRAWNLRP